MRLAFALLALAACSTSSSASSVFGEGSDGGAKVTDAGVDAAGRPCETDSECPKGFACGFPIKDGCDASAACEPTQVGACFGATLCACGGGTTLGCMFQGPYAARPVDPTCGGDAASE